VGWIIASGVPPSRLVFVEPFKPAKLVNFANGSQLALMRLGHTFLKSNTTSGPFSFNPRLVD
jgi:hypothetical protein